ncbi:MAG: PilZ domain-containing protein [Candidatus Omnitrophica bacterium]|nr:PilZ domain-containing protein [Candidatus Omnitrophota bacterium]
MLKEQRSYSRFSYEGNVVLKPEDATLRTIKADLCDICYIGIGIFSPEIIEPGIHVKFELTIKLSNEPLIGEGRIVYAKEIQRDNSRAFRIGIEFINIDNRKIISLLSLIQEDIIKARDRR